MAQYNAVFSICGNSTSTKYGQPDLEYFENLVRLPEIEAAFLFIHRGGRVLDTLRQHSRDI